MTEIPTVFQVKHNWTISPESGQPAELQLQPLLRSYHQRHLRRQWSTKSGLKGLPAGDASDAFLEAAFAGPNSPSGWRGTDSRDFEDNNYNYTFQDSLLWMKNKHSFKFGFQYQRTADHTKTNDTGSLLTTNFNNIQTAGFNATGGLITGTGNAYASFLLGAVNGATVNEDSVVLTIAQFSSYAWWVADDFKVNSRLTRESGVAARRHAALHGKGRLLYFFRSDHPESGSRRAYRGFCGSEVIALRMPSAVIAVRSSIRITRRLARASDLPTPR